jgi:hypothetical protein
MDEEKLRTLIKESAREAHREWLDETFATFGKWSMTALGAALFSALVYIILTTSGWSPPKN